jgi:hypothetical protein
MSASTNALTSRCGSAGRRTEVKTVNFQKYAVDLRHVVLHKMRRQGKRANATTDLEAVPLLLQGSYAKPRSNGEVCAFFSASAN